MKFELLKWLQDTKIQNIDLTTLFTQSDEVISDIMNCKDENLRWRLVDIYSCAEFVKKDEEFKKHSIDILKNSKFGDIELMLKNATFLASPFALELLEIVSQANEWHQSNYGYYSATDCNVLASKHAVELVKVVVNAEKEYQAEYAYDVLERNYYSLDNKHAVKLVKIVANAREEYQAEYASKVARELCVIESKHGVELVKIVANAMGEYQAEYASDVVMDGNVIESKHAIELAKLVANAKEEYQARYARDVAIDFDVLASKHAVELVKLVANAKEEYQARYARDVAKRRHAVKFVKLVANVNEEKSAKLLSKAIIENPKFFNHAMISKIQEALNLSNYQFIEYGVEVMKRATSLGCVKYSFLVQKILDGEFVPQIEDYFVSKKIGNTENKESLDVDKNLEKAFKNNNLSAVIETLNSYDMPDEKINEFVKTKVKQLK